MDRRTFLKGAGAAAVTAASYSRVMGANERIGLGIIGAGDRGQQLMHAAVTAPNVEFLGVADAFTLRHQQARKMAERAKMLQDYRDLLAMREVDAVFVATPLHLHAEHALATLAAGKDLYCEKTLAYCVEEAKKIRAAAQGGRVVGVGLQHVSSGGFADAREFLTPGNMGKITKVRAWLNRNSAHDQPQWYRKPPAELTASNARWDLFLGSEDHHGRHRDPANQKFDAHRFYNWRFFWTFSGGNITENMVHHIAFWTKALDLGLPSAATMTGGVYLWKDGREVPDTMDVTLEYPDMTFVWNAGFGNANDPYGSEVLGTDGTVVLDGKGAAHYYPEKVNRPSAAEQAGTSRGVNHIHNWIECLRSRKEPNAGVELGYRAAVACHMANQAYLKKSRVSWDSGKEVIAV